MTKRARTFLGITFAIMGVSWGLCLLCCLGLELDMDRYVILRIPFLMPGAGQYGESYLAFGVSVLGLTLALALLREKSGGVFLCVVFHSLINALSGCFIVGDDILGHALSAALLFLAVLLLQKIWPNKEETP